MLSELGDLGWQVDLVDLGESFPWPDQTARANAREKLLAIAAGRVVVIDGLALGVLPEAASDLATRNPLVALVHHPLALEWGLTAEQAGALRASERAALAATRRVVVTSGFTARLLASEYDVPAERIVVAIPGSDPVTVAQHHPAPDGSTRLLSVGAVVPRKGFDVLVAALATLIDLPWRLTIAGDRTRDRNAAAQLDAAIARHELEDRIASLGAVSQHDLAALYAQADVFVLASRFEGYGMAYAEAVARGLPVIGTTGGAIPDTVAADAALLVTPGDVPALAQALRRVISDAGLRQRLASAARTAASQLPGWRQSAEVFSRALEPVA